MFVSTTVYPKIREICPGLERPIVFQEVEAPRFQDNPYTKMVRLSALNTGHLYPPTRPGEYSWYSFLLGGHVVAQWLRHCATNRNVAGLIPDGVIGIFHRHNPSGRTMALGSTQPLTEMSTRNISCE
jgi:hypothetical protein